MVRALRFKAAATFLLCALATAGFAEANDESDEGGLEPTYQPRPPPEKESYTTDYLFALTRAVADSTLDPAARVPLFFFTVPLDVAFFPIELIAGFFPGD